MTGGLGKLNRYLLAGAGAIGILAIGNLEARATDVQQLEATLQAMQAQMKELQREVASAKAAAASAQNAAAKSGGGGGEDLDLKVKWKGAPEFSSSDGKFKFKVRGRLQTDYNGIDQDEPITGEGDISGVEIRRARLGVEGTVFYDWKYKFEVDFGGSEVAFKDAYIAYANWINPDSVALSEIRVGNQYVYTSLEQVTSSNYFTFMERASFTEAFLPSVEADRQIGAAVLLGDEHWSFQSGYYGASAGLSNDVPGQEDFDNDKSAFSVRGTVAPINREVNGVNHVVHLGAAYRLRHAGTLRDCGTVYCLNDDGEVDGSALFQYRARGADLHLADRFVDTPQFARDDDMWNVQAAFVWGPLSMQGEYTQLEAGGVRNFAGDPVSAVSPTYNGWYVDASWYLTGESRNYDAPQGTWGRTKVKNPFHFGSGGWGAWQIAGRYDVLDLGDKAAAMNASYGGTEYGVQETWLIGLNWLATDYVAVKLNVTQSHITGPVGDFNKNRGADITGVGVRTQIDW
jgi:phosphate-selective porin OprO/OprP